MKYISYKNDIVNILNSSDYNFVLKLYDSDGNTTLEPDDSKWVYIEKYKIMIEFPDDNSVLYIWKDKENPPYKFETIIQRIRELSILSGVSVEIKQYEELNRRKIYNIIKNSLNKQKEKSMTESAKVVDTLQTMAHIVSSTKRNSEKYLSESLIAEQHRKLFESICETFMSFKHMNNKHIKTLLEKSLLEKKSENITKVVESFKKVQPKLFKLVEANLGNLENVCLFCKQAYLKNNVLSNKYNLTDINENVKLAIVETKTDKDNLVKAYNHLLTICEGLKRSIDVFVAIKRHKLCETYGISKNDLIDMWLSKSNDSIKPSKQFVFENTCGETFVLDTSSNNIIKPLMKHFNNGGKFNDDLCCKIINEGKVLASLTDLISSHPHNCELKSYISIVKSLLKESFDKLFGEKFDEASFKEHDTSSCNQTLLKIERDLGFKHSGLQYVAESLFKKEQEDKAYILSEQQKDIDILAKNVRDVTSVKKSKMIAESIVKNGFVVIKPLKGSAPKEKVKSLYNNVFSTDKIVSETLNSYFFKEIDRKTRNKELKSFVDTLTKYIK